MVNFKPMKRYVMNNLEKAIVKHRIMQPFLDFGGGTGDLSLFLAQKGWSGNYEDISEISRKIAKERLKKYPVDFSNFDDRKFNSIFLFDVIEHVKEDGKLLKKLNKNLENNGHLILLVPIHKKEWGNDDVFYGHYRRYNFEELKNLLNETGYKFVDFYNVSFPAFWFLRKLYLKFIFKRSNKNEKEELSKESSYKNPWRYEFLNKLNIFWSLVFLLQDRFEKSKKGFEFLIIAKKNEI